jgi:hypothetical protein
MICTKVGAVVYVKMTSNLTGETSGMIIPLGWRAFHNRYAKWKEGALIQEAFPELNPEQREFLMTGITPSEWEEAFSAT